MFTVSRGEGNINDELMVEYQVNQNPQNGAKPLTVAATSQDPADYTATGSFDPDSGDSLIDDTSTEIGYVVIPAGQSSTTITINQLTLEQLGTRHIKSPCLNWGRR